MVFIVEFAGKLYFFLHIFTMIYFMWYLLWNFGIRNPIFIITFVVGIFGSTCVVLSCDERIVDEDI